MERLNSRKVLGSADHGPADDRDEVEAVAVVCTEQSSVLLLWLVVQRMAVLKELSAGWVRRFMKGFLLGDFEFGEALVKVGGRGWDPDWFHLDHPLEER